MTIDVDLGRKATKQTKTVKPVLSVHSKIDKTKNLMTNGSLIKVKSIAECSNGGHSAILLTCIKRLLVLKTKFGLFLVAA